MLPCLSRPRFVRNRIERRSVLCRRKTARRPVRLRAVRYAFDGVWRGPAGPGSSLGYARRARGRRVGSASGLKADRPGNSAAFEAIGMAFEPALLDRIEASVGNQRGRNADTLGRLVVLEQRGYDTRQRERAAVERVAELRPLVRVAVAEFEPGWLGTTRSSTRTRLRASAAGRPRRPRSRT